MGSAKVKCCLSPGMDDMLLYASVICFCRVCLWSAWDAAWSMPCKWEFRSIH